MTTTEGVEPRASSGMGKQDRPPNPSASSIPWDRQTGVLVLTGLSLVLYVLFTIWRHGVLFDPNEIFVEEATTYFLAARAHGFWGSLFATDAGYLNLVPRLWAGLLQEAKIPTAAVGLAYHGFAVAYAGVLSVAFCLPAFRILARSDLSRFMVSVVLWLMLAVPMKVLYNASYVNLLYIALVLAYTFALRREGRAPSLLLLAPLPLMMISKIHVLIFVPPIAWLAAKTDGRTRVAFSLSVAGALLQVGCLILTNPMAGAMRWANASHVSTGSIISSVPYFGLSHASAAMFGMPLYYLLSGISVMIAPLLGVGVVALALWLATRRQAGWTWLIYSGAYLCFGFWLVQAYGKRDLFNITVAGSARAFLWDDMWNLSGGWYGAELLALGVVLGLWSMVSERVATASRYAGVAVGAWILASGVLGHWAVMDRVVGFPFTRVSQWALMSPMIDQDDRPLCFPIAGRLYQRGDCDLVGRRPEWVSSEDVIELSQDGGLALEVEQAVHDASISGLAVGVRTTSLSGGVARFLLEVAGDQGVTKHEILRNLPLGRSLLFVPFETPRTGINGVRISASSGVAALREGGAMSRPYYFWVGTGKR